MTRAVKPRRFAIRPIIYASVLSAGVLLCAFSAHADDRDQLKSIQADIAAKERAVRQKQQQRASLLAQLKKQEEAISEATRKLRETQNTLNQLNKQIDEMNASIAKLEQQKAARNAASPRNWMPRFVRASIPVFSSFSAVKKASVVSVYRLISVISTRRDKKPLLS